MDLTKIAAQQADNITIDPSLRLYIPFNEGVGDVAKDYSQYGNNSVLTAVEWTLLGVDFNGTSSYANCGGDSSLNNTDILTIGTWIKRGICAESYPFIVRNAETKGVGLYLDNPTQQHELVAQVDFLSFGRAYPVFWGIVPFGIWTYYVFTFDGTDIKAYTDGNLIDTNNSYAGYTLEYSGATHIGSKFNGIINDVRIYNRALSALEIKTAYENERGRYEV